MKKHVQIPRSYFSYYDLHPGPNQTDLQNLSKEITSLNTSDELVM